MKLSVILPVYNASAFLDRCLESLERSEFRDYECIVVDDGSADDSRRVAERHGAIVLGLGRKGGPAQARNRGAAQARGEFLVFLDADVCVHADTLGRIATHFETHPSADAVIGSYDETPADPHFISQYKNLFHHYIHQRSRAEAWTFWAGCGAIRRQVFLELGGFDEFYRRPSIEDIELGFRLRARGGNIDLNPNIQVTHLKRWTLWSLVRTDVRDRGVPWFLLMLRARTMPRDLNVTAADRLSVALVFVLLLAGAGAATGWLGTWPIQTAAWHPVAVLASLVAVAALALLMLNYDFYRFFARKRGVLFAARTVPLHWLYYGYCGVSVAAGAAVYLWSSVLAPRRKASVARKEGAFLATTSSGQPAPSWRPEDSQGASDADRD